MGELNNRELAIAIWFGVFVIWAYSNEKVREAFKSLTKAVTTKLIIIPFVFLIAHTFVSVWLLSIVNLWNSNQVKTTLIWFFSVAAVTYFRLPKIADERNYFKNAIKDNLKVIVLLEFVISFFTFPLPIELIFVPFMFLLGGLMGVAQTDKKYEIVEKLLNKLVELIGWAIILYAVYKLSTELKVFAREETFYDFIVPVLLSFLLLPYVYVLYVYIGYEGVLQRMRCLIKDTELLAYATKKAVMNFHLNVEQLRWWAETLVHEMPSTRSDIDISIDQIKRLAKDEKTPPVVALDQGWSPYKAIEFLENEGLRTGHYKKFFDNEWGSSSRLVEIGKGIFPANASYYLEGNDKAVTRLKLNLNVNIKEMTEGAHEAFLGITSQLHLMALNKEISHQISNAIICGESGAEQFGPIKVSVSKKTWPSMSGYEIQFLLEKL